MLPWESLFKAALPLPCGTLRFAGNVCATSSRTQDQGRRCISHSAPSHQFHGRSRQHGHKLPPHSADPLAVKLAGMHAHDAGLPSHNTEHLRRARAELGWLEDAAVRQIEQNRSSSRPRADSRELRRLVEDWVEDHVERHKPLAYIIGDIPFNNMNLRIRPPILIPRPETEEWISRLCSSILSSTRPSPLCASSLPFAALDIGTGSGCLALSLASMPRRDVRVVAVDVNPDAVRLATENALLHKRHEEVEAIEADLWSEDIVDAVYAARRRLLRGDKGGEGFDLVVSNPPYIKRSDYAALDPSVRQWESSLALVGESTSSHSSPAALDQGDDGLAFYRRLMSLLTSTCSRSLLRPLSPTENLQPRPRLALEVGQGQAPQVAGMVESAKVDGIGRVEVWKDFAGIERVVVGWCR